MPDNPIPMSTAAMKALGNPLRRRILRRLGSHGPANSTTIAQALGENTGTTSYHLRKLAEAGFIAEIPERARGRERWWRIAPADRRAPKDLAPEDAALAEDVRRQRLAEDVALFDAHFARGEPDNAWSEGSRSTSHLTREELRQFHDDYLALLRRYGRDAENAAPGARPILLRWFAFPDPEADRLPKDVEPSAPAPGRRLAGLCRSVLRQ